MTVVLNITVDITGQSAVMWCSVTQRRVVQCDQCLYYRSWTSCWLWLQAAILREKKLWKENNLPISAVTLPAYINIWRTDNSHWHKNCHNCHRRDDQQSLLYSDIFSRRDSTTVTAHCNCKAQLLRSPSHRPGDQSAPRPLTSGQ